MSNEHLDRIRELCSDALWADDAGPVLDKILDHAKAMAAGLDYERKRADKAKAETGKIATECSELAKALAEAEARSARYRTAYEAEFRYNMLAIVQEFADPKGVTNAAQDALDAWQELRRHGDPVDDWQGYTPDDLATGDDA